MSNPSYAEWIRMLEADDRVLVAVEHPRPAIAVVRMQDPENMNALSGVLTVQLHRALAGVIADPAVRVVVLTGTEDRDELHGAEGIGPSISGVSKKHRPSFDRLSTSRA